MHSFIDRHVDHIDCCAVFLSHGNDPVVDFESAVTGGRSAGNEGNDLDKAVVSGQCCPDTGERKTHVDVKVFRRAGSHVVGVGTVNMSKGVEIDTQYVDLVAFFNGVAYITEPFQNF